MSPRRSNPAMRDALLAAARTEFARAGPERARVEDSARRAGISKGAFYLHFSSKEDVLREILQRFLGVIEEQADRRREAELRFERDVGRPGAGATREQVFELDCGLDTELLHVLWRNRLIVATLDRAAGEPYLAIVADFRRRMREMVGSRIALKQEEGWLRGDVGPDVIVDVILGTYEGFARRMLAMKTRPDLAGWARSFLTLLYGGVFEQGTAGLVPAASAPPRAAARSEPAGRTGATATGPGSE